MLRRHLGWVTVLALTLAQSVTADDAVQLPPEVAGHVDIATIAIAEVDMARLDLRTTFDALLKLVQDAGYAPRELPSTLRTELADGVSSLQRTGARRLFLVFDMTSIADGGFPLVLVPVDEGCDADALAALVYEDDQALAAVGRRKVPGFGEVIVVGSADRMAALRYFTPMPRPDLAAALAAVRGHSVTVVLALQRPAWQMLGSALQYLPAPLETEPRRTWSDGCQWVALGLDPPPRGRATLTIQSKDTTAASHVRQVLARGLEALEEHWKEKPAPTARLAQERKRVVASLRRNLPEVRGDRLQLSLDSDGLDAVLRDALLPAYVQVVRAGQRDNFASWMHILVVAVDLYANKHDGHPPESLDELVDWCEAEDLGRLALSHPRDPNEVAIMYVRPPGRFSDIKNPARTVIVYEKYDQWPEEMGITAGFADGHTEQIMDEDRFRKLLKAAQAESRER